MYSWVTHKHLVQWTGGSLQSPPSSDIAIKKINSDTRSIAKGDVFLALRGENFDGHTFLKQASEKGASLIISEEPLPGKTPVLIVPDSLRALAAIARQLRHHFKGPVAAITGSAGKSSTKDAVATLLGDHVLSSPASFNNLLGVSKTLCLIEDSTKAIVLEMGMNAPGEIKEMCEYFSPQAGLITNIGDAHIGKLGGREGIYRAKKELFDYLASQKNSIGIAINKDDSWVEKAALESKASKLKQISYSVEGKEATVCVLAKEMDPSTGFLRLKFAVNQEIWSEELPLFGLHHAQNIAAGLAMGLVLGWDLNSLKARVRKVKPAAHRGEIHVLASGVSLIDESYNSNPTALTSSLSSLARLDPKRRRVLVLGEMRELGEFGESLHRQVGETLAGLLTGTNFHLVGVGKEMTHLVSAVTSKIPKSSVKLVSNVEEAISEVTKTLQPGDFCLVKGSRGIKLDKLVDHLHPKSL